MAASSLWLAPLGVTLAPRLSCSSCSASATSRGNQVRLQQLSRVCQGGAVLRSKGLAMAALANEEALASEKGTDSGAIEFVSMHHVAGICENLERSLDFYTGVLGLTLNPDRPASLPYRGAWLWVGPQMIHLMELPNPDPVDGRPAYGGRDRHFCVAVKDLQQVEARLTKNGIPFRGSSSGRPALFCRDPDGNAIEFTLSG